MQFNWYDSGHKPNNPGASRQNTIKNFPPYVVLYDNPSNSGEKVGKFLFDALVNARRYLDVKVQEHVPCNDCFRRLPGKRSFKEIYNDPDVWINYMDEPDGPWGYSNADTKEIGVHSRSLTRGHLFVAATIVHEMAHLNGASGRKDDQTAEQTLKFCLLTQMFDPNVFGTIDQFSAPAGPGNAYA